MVHEFTIILDYALLLFKIISLENWDLIVICNFLACPDWAKEEALWIMARAKFTNAMGLIHKVDKGHGIICNQL